MYNNKPLIANKKFASQPTHLLFNKQLIKTVVLAGSLALPLTGWAKQLVIPNVIISGADTASSPTFVVPQDYSLTDTLSVEVTGTVSLSSARHIVNAAGIVTGPLPNTAWGVRPGQIHYTSTVHTPNQQHPWGTLLIGNSSIGFFPLFRPTPENGFGNSQPPTTLSLIDIPLSSIFTSAIVSNLKRGTILEFRINENPGSQGANTGSFNVHYPVCEGRASYDIITQNIHLPFVDVVDNKEIIYTLAVDLAQTLESTNLFMLQTTADASSASNPYRQQCHATYVLKSGELEIPFVDVPSDSTTGAPAMTFNVLMTYKISPFPSGNYDFLVKSMRMLKP